MKTAADIFKVMGDEQRLRILMLLAKKELSVCQLTGIIDVSQPLISRNLAILSRAGFLDERRDGKLKYFRIRDDIAGEQQDALDLLARHFRKDPRYIEDMGTLKECARFQKRVGRCDMKTFEKFKEYMRRKRKK